MLSSLLITPMTGGGHPGPGAEERGEAKARDAESGPVFLEPRVARGTNPHEAWEAKDARDARGDSEPIAVAEKATTHGSRDAARGPLPIGVVLALPERPASRVEDRELVERAREGDSWAREAIFRRYVTPVAAAAQRLLRDPIEVDDVVQETFLIAFEQLDKLGQPAALRGWLLQIAISRVHRRFRTWRLWRSPAGETSASLEVQATRDATPEQRAELALVDRAMAKLALPLRTAWVLRRVEGHSLEDTAEACGCSLATVKRRIGKADEVVQEYLDGRRR